MQSLRVHDEEPLQIINFFSLDNRGNIQRSRIFALFNYLMTGLLSHMIAQHFLWPIILFCLTLARIPQIHIPVAPEFQLQLTSAGAYRPDYKQAGFSCLWKLGRLARGLKNKHYLNLLGSMLASTYYTPTGYDKPTFDFMFRHISKMPWIKILSYTSVESESQLAPISAWV